MDKVKMLLIDNYDSFSYNLYQYIGEIAEEKWKEAGYELKVVRNVIIGLDRADLPMREYARNWCAHWAARCRYWEFAWVIRAYARLMEQLSPMRLRLCTASSRLLRLIQPVRYLPDL